jgi:hypothetical protein
MFTIEPWPEVSSASANVRMPRRTPVWLTASVRSQVSSGMSAIMPGTKIPALFTRTSTPPNSARTRSRIRSQASVEDTSCSTNRRPSSTAGALTSVMHTRAPSSRRWRAVPAPMPEDPPVTTATLPSSLPMVCTLR